MVVHQADVAWWTVAAASGLIKRETFLDSMTRYFEPRPTRNELEVAA